MRRNCKFACTGNLYAVMESSCKFAYQKSGCQRLQFHRRYRQGNNWNTNDNFIHGFHPSSLFCIVLNFIACNILNVVSLNGFPEHIGYKIFQAAANSNKFNFTAMGEVAVRDALKLFVDAYKQEVLYSLNLANSLLVINECMTPLLEITSYVCELDLRNCNLGDNHGLIGHIAEMKRLERLCLMHNCLSDEGIRNLTLPFRVMGKGPSCLQELDISYNSKITIKVMPWLSKFMKLKALSITSTGLVSFLQIIESRFGFVHVLSAPVFRNIETNGWASSLISDWVCSTSQLCKYPKHSSLKISTPFPSFYKKRIIEVDFGSTTQEQPVILMRS